MKKILIVAYYFPPFGGVGAVRVSKLVKYFNKFGWDITVITVDSKYYNQNTLDYNKLSEIDDNVEIISTPRLRKFTKFNEEGLYWLPAVFFTITKNLNKNKYDLIYFTGDPFIHWVVAPISKMIYKIPYLLDFRDPWMLNPYNKSKIRKWISRFMEPLIIKNAELVMNVTEDASNLYRNHYKKIEKSKFLTVENGYDPDDFQTALKIEIDLNIDGIVIGYAGKFGGFRNPIPFFDALLTYNEGAKVKFYLLHIGQPEGLIEDYIKKNPPLKKYIKQAGFMPYDKAIAMLNAVDIGLIISGNQPSEATTKIYDYIALDKPILCLSNITYGYLYQSLKDYNSIYCNNNKKSILNSFSDIERKLINRNMVSMTKERFNRKNIFYNLNNEVLRLLSGE